MIVLIPSYQPGKALVDLVDALADSTVVVVDDGSGPDYASVFAMVRARGAEVISHLANRGKGEALKTGFGYIARRFPGHAIVCADSDGQHRPADIAKVAAKLECGDAAIVLGARGFTGTVPLRSRVGNTTTRIVFGALTGRRLRDTQTGLRGYPAEQIDWLLSVPGSRFEYEQQVLLRAVDDGLPITEVDIATVYLESNTSSHFRPIRDSWAVYQPLIRHARRRIGPFTLSSGVGWLIDLTVFALLTMLSVGPLLALLSARSLSAGANFILNRHWVFGGGRNLPPLAGAIVRYASLAAVNLSASLVLLHVLVGVGVWAIPAKITCDIVLFAASFAIQRHWWGRGHTEQTVAATSDSVKSGERRLRNVQHGEGIRH
ncbi:MAG: glycosyltransferase [Microlunatus sp.]